uniref:BUD13 homolog n=1 Tax=Pogona vitticeps TaxID=103695 RepID=A0A6J0TT38_9SAUR
MAAAAASAPAPSSGLSKAEYLRRRYLEAGGAEAGKKRRKKKPTARQPGSHAGKELPVGRMRIVDDDDTSWKNTLVEQEKDDDEGDDGDLPVVAEFIDERPEEVKLMEAFRTSNKWKLLGDLNEDSWGSDVPVLMKSTDSSEDSKQNKQKHLLDRSPPRRGRHDSPDQSPPRRGRHDSSDQSPPRRGRHDSPDQSPPRRVRHNSSDQSPPRRGHGDLLDLSPRRHRSVSSKNNGRTSSRGEQERLSGEHSASQKRQKAGDSSSPPWKKARGAEADALLSQKQASSRISPAKKEPHPRKRHRHDSGSSSGSTSRRQRRSVRASSGSDLSPPRSVHKTGSHLQNPSSDLSPPRRNRPKSPDSDLSPPRRGQEGNKKLPESRSPLDSSPPHRARDAKGRGDSQQGSQMLSGGKAGLVSAELLRKEQQELKRQGGGSSKHLEAESRRAETVFRDKSGRKRDLKQERLEQQKKAEEKSERDEQYAKWGKGLAQSRQQQQNVEDAVKEMQKPLARYIDDQDLDKMLREQEREGDPMADFIRKKKASKERKDTKEKPRYNGPAPPLNRFNIWPGYRWDGVDRSNGFEQKRFARIASKKAVQELAYKWSVEDM